MRKNSRSSNNWKIDLQIPGMNQEMGFAAGIMFSLFLLGGLFIWLFLFASSQTGPVLVLELIVNGILFLVNVFFICVIGYDGFWNNFKGTYCWAIFLTIVCFRIGGVHFMKSPEDRVNLLCRFVEFLIYIVFSIFASIIPSALICLFMWLIMSIFGKN